MQIAQLRSNLHRNNLFILIKNEILAIGQTHNLWK